MGGYLQITLAVLSGVCLYAAAHHLWVGWQRPRSALHLLFAAMSVLVAIYVLAKLGSYHATTARELVEGRRVESTLAATILAALIWFVKVYTAEPARWPVIVLSALLGSVIAVNLVLPYGVAFESLPVLHTQTLPWGEQITDLRVTHRGTLFKLAWTVILATFFYTGWVSVRQFRRGNRRRAARLGAALAVFLLCVSFNQVVNYGLVEFVHTAEFGFIALVLLMSAALSHELRSSRDALAVSEAELRKHRELLEDHVRARTAQLEIANRELEAFSYSVSHDLRAPLRAVDGFAKALEEDYGNRLDATAHGYLARIRHGAQRMGVLIDDLLELSRVGRGELQPVAISLSDLAREITDRLAAAEPERTVAVTIAPGLMARADARLAQVALTNLLENAWKYTGKTAAARIVFDAVDLDGEYVFRVSDNGAGFDMQYAGRLFGAFQRLHGSDFPGTGIGLATVRRIVDRHGGRVWAEGRPGHGAVFLFTLPGREPASAGHPPGTR